MTSNAVSAGQSDGCTDDFMTGEVVCTVIEDGKPTIVPGHGGPGGPPVTQPTAADMLWWPVLVWEPDAGRTCVELRREVFPGAATSQRAEEAEARMHSLLAQWPLCTTEPGAAPASVIPFLARQYIERVGLPRPDPHIAPGYALAGKPAYLETRSTLRPPRFTAPTPAGPIEVEATGTYAVDWGDGSATETFGFEGGPWPEGRITHAYTHAGTYTVRVTTTWTATWTAGGSSGTVMGITTSATIADFEVRQLQAVRNR